VERDAVADDYTRLLDEVPHPVPRTKTACMNIVAESGTTLYETESARSPDRFHSSTLASLVRP
jgi:hypothetical protein